MPRGLELARRRLVSDPSSYHQSWYWRRESLFRSEPPEVHFASSSVRLSGLCLSPPARKNIDGRANQALAPAGIKAEAGIEAPDPRFNAQTEWASTASKEGESGSW